MVLAKSAGDGLPCSAADAHLRPEVHVFVDARPRAGFRLEGRGEALQGPVRGNSPDHEGREDGYGDGRLRPEDVSAVGAHPGRAAGRRLPAGEGADSGGRGA